MSLREDCVSGQLHAQLAAQFEELVAACGDEGVEDGAEGRLGPERGGGGEGGDELDVGLDELVVVWPWIWKSIIMLYRSIYL